MSKINYYICPECGNMSDSIKRFSLPYRWYFILGLFSMRSATYTCCPHCMRKHILINGFTYHIILMNMMWPIIILPWSIVQLIRTYQKGHFKGIDSVVENGYIKKVA